MKYIHSFNNWMELNSYIDSNEYIEPFVALVKGDDQGTYGTGIHYNGEGVPE